ncbi:HAD family hydrolase [Flavobacterium faecale]|uniref:HAD family hydrolase n=1 Tax=Flavobacterium faecale TaxID=1355330 RepID=UPI003AAF1160
MKKIKAIIFDFDGTLVDTDKFHFNCWNKSLSTFNVKLEYDYYLNHLAGVPSILNAETIIEEYGLPISVKDLADLKDENTKNLLKTETINFMPNALEVLEYFRKENMPMFLVTGSPRTEVDCILDRANIKGYFKFSITSSDVEKSKPDPEPYLTAIVNCGFSQENILVFEDTKNGILSAKSANLKCFAIQANADLQKRLNEADQIFENFDHAINYLKKRNLI